MSASFGRFTTPLLCAALLAAGATSAHAVVEPGHWLVNHRPDIAIGGPYESNLAITVHQTVAGDGTGSFLAYSKSGSLRFVTLNVDEGSELFLVKPGDLLTRDTVRQLPSLSLLDADPVNVGKDFYLGVGTRSATDPGFSWEPGTWTSWGWAHLKQDASGKLVLVDSAMAFREGGIVVGTLQAVPEPAAWATWAIGLAGLAALRKTRHSLKG